MGVPKTELHSRIPAPQGNLAIGHLEGSPS